MLQLLCFSINSNLASLIQLYLMSRMFSIKTFMNFLDHMNSTLIAYSDLNHRDDIGLYNSQ